MNPETLWPETRPELTPFMHGWFVAENAEMLGRYIGPGTRCVIEIGCWYGMSTRWICERAPAAHVYCIDPWEMYPEVAADPAWRALQPGAYRHFLNNLWEFRERVHILRCNSVVGLHRCKKDLQLEPDVVYIDGDHSAANVHAEVGMCRGAFPGLVLVGDDYGRESVKDGLRRVFWTGELLNNGVCWAFEPPKKL